MAENEKKTVTEEIQGKEETKTPSNKFTWIEVLKFTLFSISAGIIQFGLFALMFYVILGKTDESAETGAEYWIPYLISVVASVLWNFTFNRKFTFKSANNVPVAMLWVALFYAVFIPLSTWLGNLLTGNGIHELIVLAGTMLVNFATEFVYCKFWVFRK